jgi:hypothetical protein
MQRLRQIKTVLPMTPYPLRLEERTTNHAGEWC